MSHGIGCRLSSDHATSIAVAVAQAGSCSFDLTPSLGTSTCCLGVWLNNKKKGDACVLKEGDMPLRTITLRRKQPLLYYCLKKAKALLWVSGEEK